MHRFHQMLPPTENVHLHIDNFSAQTGVTRFTELHSNWRYNKTENLKAGGAAIRTFTHLLVEAKSKYAYNLKHYTVSHEILDSVDAFSHLSFNYFSFPPVKVRSKPAIFLLKNLQKDDIDWSFLPEEDQPAEKASEDSFIESPKVEMEVPPKPSSESPGLDAASQEPAGDDLPKASSKKGKKKKKKKSLPPNEEEGKGEESFPPKGGTRKNPAKEDNGERSQPAQSPDMENKDGET
ncbi:UNVERIFIED_CONTAM: hypothetical protein GTU68_030038 [Idotea baltica]|nr:hypothetical protein [Idotea baltica]